MKKIIIKLTIIFGCLLLNEVQAYCYRHPCMMRYPQGQLKLFWDPKVTGQIIPGMQYPAEPAEYLDLPKPANYLKRVTSCYRCPRY